MTTKDSATVTTPRFMQSVRRTMIYFNTCKYYLYEWETSILLNKYQKLGGCRGFYFRRPGNEWMDGWHEELWNYKVEIGGHNGLLNSCLVYRRRIKCHRQP